MKKIIYSELSEIEKTMLEKAKKSRENAYAPYSGFKVGACLISLQGSLYSGCNVESVDLTLTTHAEMNAIDTMIDQGEKQLIEIIIVMEADHGQGMPCGLCRQKILEFADKGMEILGVNLDTKGEIRDIYRTTLEELLPYSFGPEYLKKI